VCLRVTLTSQSMETISVKFDTQVHLQTLSGSYYVVPQRYNIKSNFQAAQIIHNRLRLLACCHKKSEAILEVHVNSNKTGICVKIHNITLFCNHRASFHSHYLHTPTGCKIDTQLQEHQTKTAKDQRVDLV
jgi:hypothetical protein